MSSFALAGRLLSKSRSTAVCTSLSWRARAASTTTSTSAPSSRRSRFFSVRRLTALGLVSALGTGTYVFLQDARAGAEEVAALNERNPVGTTAKRERPLTPLSTLIRTYVVYSFCSVPALVDLAPTILATLSAVPGLRQVTEAFVRVTFFDQFVGGDTAEDAIPLIEDLRAQNTGCLFAYSVEVDQDEAAGKGPAQESKADTSVYKQVVRETMHSVDVAADYEDKHTTGRTGRRTWVAIKLSAMAPDAESLRRLSQYLVDTRPHITPPVAFPGCPLPTDLDVLSSPSVAGPLTEADIAALRELREDLIAICARAQERGVRLIFDAEYSWYEPAIDAFTLDMMRLFNKLPEPQTKKSSWFGRREQAVAPPSESVQPLIYATYQAYLRRTPEYIAQSIAAAREGGYSIGLKLVRGAYHPHEVAAHLAVGGSDGKQSLSISPDPAPPVWTEKADTDARYNACVRELIKAVRADVGNATPTVGVLFGTHNWESANLIVDELARQGLGQMDAQGVVHVGDEAAERVTMGQLFGMMAVLTNYLVDRIQSSSPFVIKYIPYGQLSEVMPYLSRRAIENKSVLGNGAAQEERRRAAGEILARISG